MMTFAYWALVSAAEAGNTKSIIKIALITQVIQLMCSHKINVTPQMSLCEYLVVTMNLGKSPSYSFWADRNS